MNNDNAKIAAAYYNAMANKNIEELAKHLSGDVQLVTPGSTIPGKEAFVEAAAGYMNIFSELTVKTCFGSENKAAVVYDVEIIEPACVIPTAAIFEFKDGLISKLEIFYDTKKLEG